MATEAYALFHLNLAYSSIAEEARVEVVRRCYHPLLEMAESTGVPLGIEISGSSLELLEQIDPSWIHRFRTLLERGQCELIGSGYVQLIGPLVPRRVNEWNQRIGLESYERILAARPRIALVNEMAFSSSMVDVFAQAGYEALVMDRDNIRLALELGHLPIGDTPTHALGPAGGILPVLWADSLLFQRLQHYVHGDIRLDDYLACIGKRIDDGERLLPIYANDAEVFDFRPGRFSVESPAHAEGEWSRFSSLLARLSRDHLSWRTPGEVLDAIARLPARPAVMASAAQPVPVKKQAKYNLARWAVSGRDSTWINTMCHRFARLLSDAPEDSLRWRTLCRLWSSDLRTHITERRWQRAQADVATMARELGADTAYGVAARTVPEVDGPLDGFEISRDAENIQLTVRTPNLELVLNLRRGLNITRLAFASHDGLACVGTLPHGYFSEIALGADFYSGGTVVELPCENARITDLERVEPELLWTPGRLLLKVTIPTRLGPIVKTLGVPVDKQEIDLEIAFPGWERPRGVMHVGIVTLLPDAFTGELSIQCANGGEHRETFTLDRSFDHSAPSATIASCTTGLGATEGELELGDGTRGVLLSWDPGRCAVLPMVLHRQVRPSALTRVYFSMLELDDTLRPGGVPGCFGLRIACARPQTPC